MARRDSDRGCVAGEDLTAFAHGELDGERRATISRHLLACARCRDEHALSRTTLRRLRELGRSWSDLVPSGGTTRRATPSSSSPSFPWRSLVAGAGIAIAFLTAFLVSGAPAGGPSGGEHRAASEAQASEVSLLLAAQRPDGSWPADGEFGGPAADEAATAVALLALLPEDPRVLREGPRARAVADATRWLLARRRASPSPFGVPAQVRNDVVALAALVELQALTGDAGLRRELEPWLRRARGAIESASADPWALRWLRRALTRAKEAGWPGLDAVLRSLDARRTPLDDRSPTGTADWTSEDASTPGATSLVAVRVLSRRS